MTETGEPLETVRISNDPDCLRGVISRVGEAPGGGAEAALGYPLHRRRRRQRRKPRWCGCPKPCAWSLTWWFVA